MGSLHAKMNDLTFKIIGNIFMEELRSKSICLVLSQHFSSTFGMIIKEIERWDSLSSFHVYYVLINMEI